LPTTPTVAQALTAVLATVAQTGIAKGHVANDAIAEKGGDAIEGAVDELVGHDEIGRLVLFFERADGRDGQMRSTPSFLNA
jgi:hypothetical protein